MQPCEGNAELKQAHAVWHCMLGSVYERATPLYLGHDLLEICDALRLNAFALRLLGFCKAVDCYEWQATRNLGHPWLVIGP